MKRKTMVLLALLLIMSAMTSALAVPQISNTLFNDAKQALKCLSSGEYEKLVTVLPFADIAPSASEWQNFAEGNFSNLSGNAQCDYAVAYWNGSMWKLAVPVSEPSSDTVETLVLSSADGIAFSGYAFMTWAEVKGEYLFAPYVIWDKEYVSAAPVIAID